MLLIEVFLMVMRRLPTMTDMFLNEILVFLDLILIHLLEQFHAELDITEELIAPRLREILTNDHAQHLQILGFRGHGVCGDDP